MLTSLEGKSAIVTGASKGIGKGIARVFARHGACVLVVARHIDAAEAAAKEIRDAGHIASAFAADVTDLAGMEAAHMPAPLHLLDARPYRCGCGREWGCVEVYTTLSGLPYLLAERLGERARPYAGTHLDLAETRGDRPAFDHWMAVVASLRQRAGLVEAAED